MSSTIAKKTPIGAKAVGTSVDIQIGNQVATFGYEDALKFANFIRMAGKRAKANAGDNSRHWSIVANLSSQEKDEGVSYVGNTH